MIRLRSAALGKISALECEHMQMINDSTAYPDEVSLEEASLRELSSEGTFKLLTSKTIENCLKKNSSSALAQSPSVMAVVSERYITLSVFDRAFGEQSNDDDQTDSSSSHMAFVLRSKVLYDKSKGYLNCDCSKGKQFCIHKAMSLWYLYQRKLLKNSSEVEIEEELDENENDIVSPVSSPQFTYPPVTEEEVIQMAEYLKEHCKISCPIDESLRTFDISLIPTKFTPRENNCHKCGAALTEILFTKRGKVLTRTSKS